MDQPYLQFHKDKVVLHADITFLPKVVSVFHVSRTLRCLLWPQIRPLIPSTSSTPSTLEGFWPFTWTSGLRCHKRLFATRRRRRGLPVTAQRFSKWVAGTIHLCYELSDRTLPSWVRVHSTRVVATSSAFLTGVPLEDVCKAAVWIQPLTFIKHYRLDTRPDRLQLLRGQCCCQIPVNTYKPPKLRQKLEQIKLENRRKAEELLLEANINQFNCAAPKNDHKSPIASEIRNYSEKFQAQKIQGKVDNIPVKLNSTAILREGVLYQRKVEQELNRIEHLLRGARDPSEFLEWQKQMCGKDLDQQLIEEECRRLQGKLSYEEAILARQNCIRENQKKAEQKREKKEELSQQCAQRNLQEMKERKKTVQQVTEARKNVKQARLKLQKYKRQIVQEVSEENQQILIQALKEEEEKIKKRCELIQQIRAIEYLPILKSKFVDLTQTPDHGVLGEMSIVELQERLALLKEAQKKAEEEKRDQIILEKHMKEQLLLGKLEQISTFREQLGRAAALKQEKKKIKTTFHGSIWKDEQVLDLQKKIEKKSMERKIPPEYLKTKPQKLHEGSKRSSISQKKYQQEDHWKKLEKDRKEQFKMLQHGFVSREVAQKMVAEEAMKIGTNACILRSQHLAIQHQL